VLDAHRTGRHSRPSHLIDQETGGAKRHTDRPNPTGQPADRGTQKIRKEWGRPDLLRDTAKRGSSEMDDRTAIDRGSANCARSALDELHRAFVTLGF